MTDWKKTTEHITFVGKTDVLSRIAELEQEKQGPLERLSVLLDYEIVIPTKGFVACLTLFAVVVGIRWSDVPEGTPTYPIAVINERGLHEKTY
jgi:hypothetical protein